MALLDEYRVGVDGPWGDAEAAHLLRRAGFGGPPEARAEMAGDGSAAALDAAVDTLVAFQDSDPWLDQAGGTTAGGYGDPLADLPDDDSDLGRVKRPRGLRDLIGHWLYRMRFTAQPLQEQLALLLHDHFVSQWSKIRPTIPPEVVLGNDGTLPNQPCMGGTLAVDLDRAEQIAVRLMLDQYRLLRTEGAEDFRQLLIDITRDPCMLIYLDNVSNQLGRPQENYARELMELFSMGEGNYSEEDVRQVARCLTGETLPRFRCEGDWDSSWGFRPGIHEPGEKTVFGTRIAERFDGQETIEVIDLIMDRVATTPDVSGLGAPYNTLPATAVFTAWKLLTWFVKTELPLDPPHPAVLELAHYLRGTDNAPYPFRRFRYDVRAALRKLFKSQFFFAQEHRLAMHKTPADFVIGAQRALGVADLYTGDFGPGIQMVLMGMILFEPPNVGGWLHGRSWITAGSLVARYNYGYYLADIILGGEEGDARIDELLAANGGPILSRDDDAGLIEHFRGRLLQSPLSEDDAGLLAEFLDDMPGNNPERRFREKVRGLIHVMLTMPAAQLK